MEIFVYLGKSQGTHFFAWRPSTIDNLDFCPQVYNTMIHQTMIVKDDIVIVYVFAGDHVEAVITQHANFTYKTFNNDNLTEMLSRLLSEERDVNDNMVIVFNGVFYDMVDSYDISALMDFRVSRITEQHNFVSTKPIPYL